MKKVLVKGTIVSNDYKAVYEWYGIESTAPNDIRDAINSANGEDLEVEIMSGGGDVFAGSEIYTLLKQYERFVTVKVMSIAASAASVIAMAGNKILMSPTSQIMIHNASASSSGDYRDLNKTAEILQGVNETIANAYMLKTGKSKEEVLALMDEETWLTPQMAIEHKFADEIMFGEQLSLTASAVNGILPMEVVNKALESIRAEKESKLDIIKAKLNELKKGGE